MSKIKNGGLDQYGKVWLTINGIGCERVKSQWNKISFVETFCRHVRYKWQTVSLLTIPFLFYFNCTDVSAWLWCFAVAMWFCCCVDVMQNRMIVLYCCFVWCVTIKWWWWWWNTQVHETALHKACREDLLPVVGALCAYGCPVNIFNKVCSPLCLKTHLPITATR